jgi:hypothetical protein
LLRTLPMIELTPQFAPGPVVLNGNYIDGAGSGLAVNPTRSAALWLRICAGANCGVNSIIGKVRNNRRHLLRAASGAHRRALPLLERRHGDRPHDDGAVACRSAETRDWS